MKEQEGVGVDASVDSGLTIKGTNWIMELIEIFTNGKKKMMSLQLTETKGVFGLFFVGFFSTLTRLLFIPTKATSKFHRESREAEWHQILRPQ